jgi:hypothetical protein
MNLRYRVELSQAEREHLRGAAEWRQACGAQIETGPDPLLAADAGTGDEESAATVGIGGSTVYRTKRGPAPSAS